MASTLRPAWHATLDDYPTALGLSRDGSLLASGSAAGTLTIWDPSAGDAIHTIAAHEQGLLCASFGRNFTLATGGQDGNAKLWDAKTGTLTATLASGGSWVNHLVWSPDGKRLATAAGRKVKLWDASGTLLQEWQLKAGVNGMGFNPVGGLLAVAAGAEVSLLRTGDGGTDRTLKWASTLLNLAYSPDGKILACGSLDKTVHFWRAGAWTDSQMAGYLTKPSSIAFTADGKQLATTGDECLIVWNFSGKGPEGVAPMQLYGHVLPPTLVAAHPKQALLLSGAKDHRVALWAPKVGDQPQAIAALSAEVAALAFHPSANLIYGADASGRLQAWWLDTQG